MDQVKRFRGYKALEQAKLTGVLICSAAEFRDSQYAAVYYWHEHCRLGSIPMILVVESATTATVTVNMNFAFSKFSPPTVERLHSMIRDVCSSDSKHTARPFARVRDRSALIQGARRDKLQAFLNELVYVLYVDELHLDRPMEAVSL